VNNDHALCDKGWDPARADRASRSRLSPVHFLHTSGQQTSPPTDRAHVLVSTETCAADPAASIAATSRPSGRMASRSPRPTARRGRAPRPRPAQHDHSRPASSPRRVRRPPPGRRVEIGTAPSSARTSRSSGPARRPQRCHQRDSDQLGEHVEVERRGAQPGAPVVGQRVARSGHGQHRRPSTTEPQHRPLPVAQTFGSTPCVALILELLNISYTEPLNNRRGN